MSLPFPDFKIPANFSAKDEFAKMGIELTRGLVALFDHVVSCKGCQAMAVNIEEVALSIMQGSFEAPCEAGAELVRANYDDFHKAMFQLIESVSAREQSRRDAARREETLQMMSEMESAE